LTLANIQTTLSFNIWYNMNNTEQQKWGFRPNSTSNQLFSDTPT